MGSTTTVHHIPYPLPADIPNIPADMQSLAEKVDSSLFLTQILQCTSTTRPTGGSLFTGRFIFETDTKAYGIYDGTTWRIWDTVEQTFTPSWKQNGVAGGALGTGGSISSTYVRRGARCRIDIQMAIGSSGFNGGSGNWSFVVPVMPTHRGHFGAKCWAPNAGGSANFSGYAYVDGGSTTMYVYMPNSPSDCSMARVQNANNAGAAGTGVPHASGFTWTSTGDLSIYGEYPI